MENTHFLKLNMCDKNLQEFHANIFSYPLIFSVWTKCAAYGDLLYVTGLTTPSDINYKSLIN
jgi:hypothetical protein